MKILLADEYLLFCGQVCNKQIAGRVNVSGQQALTGASHG
jgi:hypothetical protein